MTAVPDEPSIEAGPGTDVGPDLDDFLATDFEDPDDSEGPAMYDARAGFDEFGSSTT